MKTMLGTIVTLFFMLLATYDAMAGEADGSKSSVVYRLKWLKNMSTVGDLYADAYGFFKAQGLSVIIKSGGPEKDTIRELELGQAHFGVASADQVIRAVDKGAPVFVVAQLFQINPLQWIYRPDRLTIGRLADLKGLKLGVTFGKNDEIIMRTLLSRAQIEVNQVKLFSVRLDYTPFYKGGVDLWPVYINTQGVEIGGKLRAAGEKISFFNPAEYGVRFVANSVVTSEKMIKQHPAKVKRFVCALLRGWEEAMKPINARSAIEAVQQDDRDSTHEILVQQLEATRKLVRPTPQRVIGAFDRDAWQETENIMLAHQQISRPVGIVQRLYAGKCQ